MTNFCYNILTLLCVQYTWGIEKTEILPKMEPYNRTHCKIIFETSFVELPNQYIAKLTEIKNGDVTNGNRESDIIEDNFVRFKKFEDNFVCKPSKTFPFMVEIYYGTNTDKVGEPSKGRHKE